MILYIRALKSVYPTSKEVSKEACADRSVSLMEWLQSIYLYHLSGDSISMGFFALITY